jgi:preprotein translocase SecF subunit
MKKEKKVFNFYQKCWVFFIISAVIMLMGIVAVFINGVHLDIQFKGGALIKYTYTGEIDAQQAADVATTLLGRPATTQTTSDLLSGDKRLVINIAGENGLEAQQQDELDAALKAEFSNNILQFSESSMVEPFFGQRFLTNGIISLFLASVLVVLYVWIRFRRIGGLSAGMMALAALLHDLLVVFFTCVIFRIPIGDSFVAVALTIIGYSINDTIVIYDRIRENSRLHAKLPIETITNLSISQSFTRSVNTNLAVLISISLVYILAFAHNLDSVQSFALPMAIGAVSGCYSTICIAGPLWVMWKKRQA